MLCRGESDDALMNMLLVHEDLYRLFTSQHKFHNQQYLLNATWWMLLVAARKGEDDIVDLALERYRKDKRIEETNLKRRIVIAAIRHTKSRWLRQRLAGRLIARSQR